MWRKSQADYLTYLRGYDKLMADDDFMIVLSPSEMDYLRTALRNESARLKREGFTGLQSYVDNLRDKVSNQMIDQAHTRIDTRASV